MDAPPEADEGEADAAGVTHAKEVIIGVAGRDHTVFRRR
jgi:hypothetical protein